MAPNPLSDTINTMTGPQYGPPPTGPWQEPPRVPPIIRNSRLPLILGICGMILGLIGTAIGIAAWSRPTSQNTSQTTASDEQIFTSQEIDEATKAMCDAYDKTGSAVAGTAGSQSEPDPLRSFIMTVDTRFAFHVSMEYLTEQLELHPATPPELAQNFRELVSAYDELLLLQLARVPQEDLEQVFDDTDSAETAVAKSCN